MNQSNKNPYEQYSYDHYDQAPRASRPSSGRRVLDGAFGPDITSKLRNPLIATAALLVVGAAFAGVIIASYPDSTDTNVPVIKADTTAYKSAPDAPGGMDVPHRDSTIFQTMGENGVQERAPVENLLEDEAPVNKAEAFAAESELEGPPQPATVANAAATTEPAAGTEEASTDTSTNEVEAPSSDTLASAEKPKIEVKTIIQENEKVTAKDLMAEAEAEGKVAAPEAAEIAAAEAAPPQTLHAPASSPETIAFVRSVLDKKDTQKVLNAPANGAPTAEVAEAQATNIAAVEPASGTPATEPAPTAKSAAVTPGNYFIQLGSVKTRDGAASEWGKLQKTFSDDLQGLEYRVQEATVADRGTFYRIQAGPISKDSANSICDSIKSQKPGGCLVVQ